MLFFLSRELLIKGTSDDSTPPQVRPQKQVKIFVFSAGQQIGPFSEEKVRKELLNGSLKPSDLAWHNRLRRWVPLQQLAIAEPRSKRKYAMPPRPEDSPFYTPEAGLPQEPPRKRPIKKGSLWQDLCRRLNPFRRGQ